MICKLWKRIGHVLRVWLLSPGSIYEDDDRLGYYDGAAPDFASQEAGRTEEEQITLENAWDDEAFERWRAGGL